MKDIMQNPTIIGLLPEGTEVYVLEHLSDDSHSYVAADRIRGWVKKKYIRALPGVQKRSRSSARRKPVLFSDVPKSHWARKAVERLVSAGLIANNTSRFRGNKGVTRYELAVVLDRAHRRAEQSRASIESRLKALESGRSGSAKPGGQYQHLLSLAHTLRRLEAQSEEMRGRLDALEPDKNWEMARRLRAIEHRLDSIERVLDHG